MRSGNKKRTLDRKTINKTFDLVFNAVQANQVTQIHHLAKKYKNEFSVILNNPMPETVAGYEKLPTLLLFACHEPSVNDETIETLIEFGADINFSSHVNITPLLLATLRDRPNIVNLLLKKEAS